MSGQKFLLVTILMAVLALLAGCAIPVTLVSTVPQAAGAEIDMSQPPIQRTDSIVDTHPSQGEVRSVEGATATLFTTEEGATIWMRTTGLRPGHVNTLWWVIINNPAACAGSPCTPADVLGNTDAVQADIRYADAIIVGEDGAGHFAAHLPVGALPDAWFGNGFTNPLGADIHLVVNDHGPLIPEMADTMLNSYRGGCTDESLPPPFPDTAKADGEPGPNGCQLVQQVTFEQ